MVFDIKGSSLEEDLSFRRLVGPFWCPSPSSPPSPLRAYYAHLSSRARATVGSENRAGQREGGGFHIRSSFPWPYCSKCVTHIDPRPPPFQCGSNIYVAPLLGEQEEGSAVNQRPRQLNAKRETEEGREGKLGAP